MPHVDRQNRVAKTGCTLHTSGLRVIISRQSTLSSAQGVSFPDGNVWNRNQINNSKSNFQLLITICKRIDSYNKQLNLMGVFTWDVLAMTRLAL